MTNYANNAYGNNFNPKQITRNLGIREIQAMNFNDVKVCFSNW